jgi:hypothetical protein
VGTEILNFSAGCKSNGEVARSGEGPVNWIFVVSQSHTGPQLFEYHLTFSKFLPTKIR